MSLGEEVEGDREGDLAPSNITAEEALPNCKVDQATPLGMHLYRF